MQMQLTPTKNTERRRLGVEPPPTTIFNTKAFTSPVEKVDPRKQLEAKAKFVSEKNTNTLKIGVSVAALSKPKADPYSVADRNSMKEDLDRNRRSTECSEDASIHNSRNNTKTCSDDRMLLIDLELGEEKLDFEMLTPELRTKRRPIGPNGTPKQTFQEWCAENGVTYDIVRKVCRQRVRDTDPGLVWDSFELPKEFEDEEIPPYPTTPIPSESNSPSYYFSEIVPKFKDYKPGRDTKTILKSMDDIIQNMHRGAEQRKQDYERRGIVLPAYQDLAAFEKGGFDLNTSFTMDYSPTTTPKIVSVKRGDAGKAEGKNEDGIIPSRRPRFSASAAGRLCDIEESITPRKRKHSMSCPDTPYDSTANNPQLLKRTRLSFSEDVTPTNDDDDETVWPDEDILSQINLNHLEISSATTNENSTAQVCPTGNTVDGEGFEDSDPGEDLMFTQLNY